MPGIQYTNIISPRDTSGTVKFDRNYLFWSMKISGWVSGIRYNLRDLISFPLSEFLGSTDGGKVPFTSVIFRVFYGLHAHPEARHINNKCMGAYYLWHYEDNYSDKASYSTM